MEQGSLGRAQQAARVKILSEPEITTMAKGKNTKAIETESKTTYSLSEIAEMVAAMTPEAKLALLAETTTKEERKSLNQAETNKAKRVEAERLEAEKQASRDAEESTLRGASDAELATLKVKHHTTAKRITELTWDVESTDWVETVRWDFGKTRSGRSGTQINKRVIDQDRVIFPSGTRIVVGNTEHVHATKACDSLNIDHTNDSAARALCNESLAKNNSLGVTIRLTTPAGTTETSLFDYATSERVTIALATRD